MHIKSFFIPLFFCNYLVGQMQYWNSPKYALSIHNLPRCYQTIRPPKKEDLRRHCLSIRGHLNKLPIEIERRILEYVLGNSLVTYVENGFVAKNSSTKQDIFTIASPYYLASKNCSKQEVEQDKKLPIRQIPMLEFTSDNKDSINITYADPRVIVYYPQKDLNYRSKSIIEPVPLLIVDKDFYHYRPWGYGDYQTKEVSLPNKTGDVIILQRFSGQGNIGYIVNLDEQKEKKLQSLNSGCIQLEWNIQDIVLHPTRHTVAVLSKTEKTDNIESFKPSCINIFSWYKQRTFFNLSQKMTKKIFAVNFDHLYDHPQFYELRKTNLPDLTGDNPQYNISITSLGWLENKPNILTFTAVFSPESSVHDKTSYLFFYDIEKNNIVKIVPANPSEPVNCKRLEYYELQ